jgi:hypothetical protein
MRVRSGLLVLLVAGLAIVVLPASALGAEQRARIGPPGFRAPAGSGGVGALADPPGPFSIGGTVFYYDGTPVDHAYVDWGWFDPNAPVWFGPDVVYHEGGHGSTNADGVFSFASVTSSPGNDDLTVFAPNGGYMMSSWTNDFSTQSSYVMRPGRVPITIVGLPEGAQAQVTVGDAATGSASTWPDLTAGQALVMTAPPGFNTAVVQLDATWGPRAALDWTSPGGTLVAATPGTTSSEEIVLDWAEARRGYVAGTRWQHSVRPGDLVTFVLRGWPSGYQASFSGTSYGEGPTRWYGSTYTSQGSDQIGRITLRIPRDIPLDDLYTIAAYRSDAPGTYLYFQDYVQPCRFRASQTAIRAGEAIRLRGFVLGDDRRVELFECHSAAGQPASAIPRGWKKVATFTASRDGTFRSAWRRPSRTTWYVARIRGYYFPVYTPVVKVAVR